jgi:hypothetical protein
LGVQQMTMHWIDVKDRRYGRQCGILFAADGEENYGKQNQTGTHFHFANMTNRRESFNQTETRVVILSVSSGIISDAFKRFHINASIRRPFVAVPSL